MVLEKGGEGWKPEVLVTESQEEDLVPESQEDLARLAARLKVDRQAVEDWKKIDYSWDNRLRRLVEKDGTLNMVCKRSLYHLAVWEYKSLMRLSFFSLILWCLVTYVVFATVIAGVIYWSNHGYKTNVNVNTNLTVMNDNEERYRVWFNVNEVYQAFLLALEMVATIGYGKRAPNSATSVAVTLTMLIRVLGVMMISLFSGVFLTWIMNSQASKIKFSSQAVISKKDGCLALMVRLADPVVSGLAMLEVSGFCVLVGRDLSSQSSQGESSREVELRHMGDMSFTAFSKGEQGLLPLMWPTVVAHYIDDTSPLYTYCPDVLDTHSLEIIINVSGFRDVTGSRILCKTSYISEEIIWGARFSQKAVLFRKDNVHIGSFGQRDIDKVIMERNFPRDSAQALAMKEGEESDHTKRETSELEKFSLVIV